MFRIQTQVPTVVNPGLYHHPTYLNTDIILVLAYQSYFDKHTASEITDCVAGPLQNEDGRYSVSVRELDYFF